MAVQGMHTKTHTHIDTKREYKYFGNITSRFYKNVENVVTYFFSEKILRVEITNDFSKIDVKTAVDLQMHEFLKCVKFYNWFQFC